MRTKISDLPAFAFPVVAWAPEAATGDPHDSGTREFLTPLDVTTIYFPKSDLRLGWTFVDAEGSCWEAVSSQVTGRADAWWKRALPKWIHHPQYRLAYDFAERPPVSFNTVKSRLFAAVTANPEAYRDHYGRSRRQELREAKSLSDLIKPEEAFYIERLTATARWWQWLSGEGRCSRLTFLIAGAVIATVIWFAAAWRIPAPMFVAIIVLCFSFGMSAIIRRLHDMRRTGWWFAPWLLFNIVCAQVHNTAHDPSVKAMAVIVWPVATLAALGFLAIAPGVRGPNRYGFAPRWGRCHRAASDAASL